MAKSIKSTIPSYGVYQQALANYKSTAKEAAAKGQKIAQTTWSAKDAPSAQVPVLLALRDLTSQLAQLFADASTEEASLDGAKATVETDVGAYLAQLAAAQAAPPKGSQPKKAGEKLESYTFPDDIETADIKVVNANPGGTTGAQIVEIGGLKYVYKTDRNVAREHVENEAAADLAYRAAGVRVPDCKVYHTKDGKTVKLSQFVEGGTSLQKYMASADPAQKQAVIEQLSRGYMVDALAANWDVLGTAQDNVLVDKDGRVWRIDNGSAFEFRAQGAKKKPEEFAQRDFPDEWRSLRESPINRGVFDKLSAYDIFSSDVDLDAFAQALPPQTQKALAKPLKELKEMQTRCHGAMAGGYQPGSISAYLENAYSLSKTGYREEVPSHISEGNFGFCRRQYHHNAQPHTPPAPDYSATITQAAITINKHCGYGKNGASDTDYQPNMASVNAALAQKPQLETLAKAGNKDAADLLTYIQKIEEAQARKWKRLKKIPNVPQYSFPAPPPPPGQKPQPKASQYVSLTDHLYQQAKAVPMVDKDGRPVYDANGKQKTQAVNVARIHRYFQDQAHDSWEYGDACRLKVVELAARGKNWNPPPPDPDVWYGDSSRNLYYQQAVQHYIDHPNELEEDKQALEMWRAATTEMLENADFDGNMREGRYMVIGRTDDVQLYSTKPGTVGDAFPMGPCESAAAFSSKQVQRPGVGVRLVPYERIYSCYFMDGTPSGGDMYLGDYEREVGSDATGLPVYYAGKLGSGYDYMAHWPQIKAQFAAYYDARPALERPWGI